MARKRSKTPVRIWAFEAKASENRTLERDLLHAANRHYNRLVEIERGRLRAFRELREACVPGITEVQRGFEEANIEYEEVNDLVKKSRQEVFLGSKKSKKGKTSPKVRVVPPELKQRYEEIKARRKALGDRHRELSAAFSALLEPANAECALRRHLRAQEIVPKEVRYAVETELREKLASKGWNEAALRRFAGGPAPERAPSYPEYETLRLAAVAAVAAPRKKEKINAEVYTEMLREDWPEAWKWVVAFEEKALREQKAARASCQVSSGCYLQVEAAVEQAIKNSDGPPSFRTFSGAKIAVQTKSTFGEVLDGACSSLRLRPTKSIDRENTRRALRSRELRASGHVGESRKASLNPERDHEFFTASVRVGKCWIDFPVRLHRLPSPEVKVKWAWVNVKKIGGERFKYKLELTLEGESLVRQRPYGDGGTVEVSFCSQTVPGGVRVAEWRARETGAVGEVVLPARIAERLAYPAVLRSHADTHFDEVKEVLKKAFHVKQLSNSENTRLNLRGSCIQWAQHVYGNEHLTEIWQDWKAERLSSGRDLFPRLGTCSRWMAQRGAKSGAERLAFWLFLWVLKDRHLRRSAGHMRDRSEHQRDAKYREAALDLRAKFSDLVCDSSNLSQQKRRPRVEDESNEYQRLRTLRQNAAPGRCRELLKEVFGPRAKSEKLGGDESPGGAREGEDFDSTDVFENEDLHHAAE